MHGAQQMSNRRVLFLRVAFSLVYAAIGIWLGTAIPQHKLWMLFLPLVGWIVVQGWLSQMKGR